MIASYFNGRGSEIQADNLQTLYLMNPSYSDAPPPPPGMFLINPAAHALNPGSLQHAPPPHLVGIPLHQSGSASPLPLPEIPGFAPRFHYNLNSGGELGSPVGFRRPPPVSVAASTFLDHQQHQLSLCLNNSPANKVTSPCGGTPTSASGVSTGGGQQGGIVGSKYMKAAQQLLDETVNVWKAMNMADSGRKNFKAAIDGCDGGAGESSGDLNKEGSAPAAELGTAQRQELQMKKAKLLNMLDEVEQRYRQYHSQMQAVASLLEHAAGVGSAKSYTALTLHTISKQFRCLKDAIAWQIKETGRSLGEEDDGKRESRRRLRMVDQQMRQQLSVMHHQHHNAWRTQRGLPERAVSVLRAWLFEHFLHPYPKDSDKHMLAKQSGLTRNQVSNWFINARVRLWKPMVEEMYLEETKGVHQQNESDDHDKDQNKDSTHTSKLTPTLQSPRIPQNPNSINHIPNSTLIAPPPASTGPTLHGLGSALQGFSLAGIESSKRQRSNSVADIQNDSQSSIILSMDHPMEMKDINTHHGGFGPNYPVGDIGSRFNPDHHHHHHHQQLGHGHYHQAGNSVSLTLGLPHSENLLSSLSGTHHHQQNFIMPRQAVQLGRRPDIGIGETEFFTSLVSHSEVGGGGYDGVDIQNRKRFAAQLLSDFVA